MGTLNYVYIVICDGRPILAAHDKDEIERMLHEYIFGSEEVKKDQLSYQPYDSKYPSINDLEGIYYYKNEMGGVDEFRVYGSEYSSRVYKSEDSSK